MTAQEQPIRIAIVGHTNGGKTTFIRTLMRQLVGEVEDRANVTQLAEDFHDTSLGITFVDTPGYQNSGEFLIRSALSKLKNAALELLSLKRGAEAVRFDQRAFEALENCDAVLYVASLADSPDDAHAAEIELTTQAQRPVVGVINQYASAAKRQGVKAAKNRIEQWHAFFDQNNVNSVIEFDSYWAHPATLLNLYEIVMNVLPEVRRSQFVAGLRTVKNELIARRVTLSDYIAQCLSSCQCLVESADTVKFQYDSAKAKTHLAAALRTGVERKLADFVAQAKDVYRIDANQPHLYESGIALLVSESKDPKERQANMIASGTKGAWGLGLLGAVVGTFFFPGPGTAAGAAIGGALGGLFGAASGAGEPTNTHMSAALTDADLRYVFECCIGVAWALSFQGFGRGDRVNEQVVEELRSRVKGAVTSTVVIGRSSTREQITTAASGLLERFDSTPPVHL